jgi:hypothetical protein
MTTTYAIGTEVTYAGELPCDEATHGGTVIAVEDDASGDQVVTVEFGCGITQDILASELRPA